MFCSKLAGLEQHLPDIALVMVRGGDIKSFGQMLLLCANVPKAAWDVCGAVAHLYPEQAAEVADVVIEHTWE